MIRSFANSLRAVGGNPSGSKANSDEKDPREESNDQADASVSAATTKPDLIDMELDQDPPSEKEKAGDTDVEETPKTVTAQIPDQDASKKPALAPFQGSVT